MAQQRRRTLREVLAKAESTGGDADCGDHGCAVPPRRRLGAGAGAARCEAPPDAPPSPSESSSSSSSSSGSASSAMLESLHDEISSASETSRPPTPLKRSSSLEGQVGGSGVPSPGGGGWTLKKEGDRWRLENTAASGSGGGSAGRGAISVVEKAGARETGESDDVSSGGGNDGQREEKDVDDDDDDEWRLVVPRSAPSAPKRDNDNVQDDDDAGAGHESDGEWTSCSEPRPDARNNNGAQAPTEGGAGGGTTNNDNDLLAVARKAGVAVSGGALVGLGLVMIPLPTPFGCAVAASGMAVLGTEFPAAQRALDGARDNLAAGLERMASLDEGDDQNGRGGEGGEDRVVMNGDAVLVRRPTSMDGDEDGTAVKATANKKGGGSDLDDLAEEAGRALRRKASEFGRRVLPLVVRPTENSEGGKNDTEKSGKDGEGDASADATRGRIIRPSSPRSTARQPGSQSRTYLDYIDSVRNLREMDD